jgi:hypothetical protein
MKFNELYTEEKVRLDPKCWTGKKIGNPKTKVKGGVRVNNCVPAESVAEDLPPAGYGDYSKKGATNPDGTASAQRQADREFDRREYERKEKERKNKGVAEDGSLDNARQRVQSQGFTDSPEERNADRLERRRRHNEKMDKMHRDFMSRGGDTQSDYNRKGDERWNKELDHASQQRMNRDAYDTQRRKDNDVDWRDTYDMMRDRINRFQSSSQRGVDPDQLAKISAIKYKPIREGAGRGVDAKGRTQEKWLALVNAKFPPGGPVTVVKLIQAKMIDGPIIAYLSNGKQIGWEKVEQGVAEDAVADFLARGGEIQQGKLHKPRKGETWQGSSHIGAAGGKGTKGTVSGRAANTNPKGGKPVVSAEGYNPEYDDEAGMADNNLETLQRAVEGIDELIDSGDNLPEWCQEKIAVAKSMLVAVWDYMYSEEASDEVDPEIDAMFEAMQDLVSEMAQKNRVSEDLVWESFEALPDNVLYETAAWRRKEGKSKKGGLNAKGVASYRRENPGSKLQTAVTTKPSKLKPGSKAAKRRKSFCARMGGVKGPMKKPNGKPTRKALALRKWNC